MNHTFSINQCRTSAIEIAKEYGFNKQKFDRALFNKAVSVNHFIDIFSGINKQILDQIEYASTIYSWALLSIDHVLDNPNYSRKEMKDDIMLAPVLREQALRVMYTIFPPNSNYWVYFDRYNKKYTRSCQEEYHNHYEKITEYSLEEMEFIMTGLPALMKAVPAAMAFLSTKLEYLNKIEKSIDYFHIAVNLKDDVDDWRTDYQNKEFSYFLTTLIIKYDLSSKIDSISIDKIGKLAFISGLIDEMLTLSLQYFDRALEMVQDINCEKWKEFITQQKEKCQKMKDDISESIEAELFRIGGINTSDLFHPDTYSKEKEYLPVEVTFREIDNPWFKLSVEALKYIIRKSENGFKEANHVLWFGHSSGFQSSHEYQLGNVFSRALITEILISVNKHYSNQLESIIDREVSFLVNIRTPETDGWSYFPYLDELPDDADTLGQIIQVFCQAEKRQYIQQYCTKPLKWIFNNSYSNGSFETWIIPPAAERRRIHVKQLEFIHNVWGNRQDVEVVANLLYGAFLFSRDQYSERIHKGVEYIIHNQQKRGYWNSTWYHGPYYGIYVSLRLLVVTKPQSKSIPLSVKFLLKTQKEDGGWGLNEERSDPLSTAFALIALGLVCKFNKEMIYYDQIIKGLQYLKKTVHSNGSWRKTKFIKMIVMQNNKPKTLTYSSTTITTAYVLKALIEWYKCNQ